MHYFCCCCSLQHSSVTARSEAAERSIGLSGTSVLPSLPTNRSHTKDEFEQIKCRPKFEPWVSINFDSILMVWNNGRK